MMKVLVTGSNGLVGQALVRSLASKPGFEVLATSRSESRLAMGNALRFDRMDITSPQRVREVVGDFRPDAIIHSAALTQVDPCELNPDECDRVNIDGTRTMTRAAEEFRSRFLFVSTDFVFDGEAGPYSEDDPPNPVNQYGWSKLQGEFLTRSLRVPWAIARTILVYGAGPGLPRSNLVTWIYDSLSKGQSVRVVDDQIRMPTLVDDLADGMIRILERGRTGIYHLSGPETVSVFAFARQVARFFHLDESLIQPVDSASLNQAGKRPPSTGFTLDKAIRDLDYAPKNIVQGLTVVRNLIENQDSM